MISAVFNPRKSQQFQSLTAELSYHGQIGRETTAYDYRKNVVPMSYHGQIGRETTANRVVYNNII